MGQLRPAATLLLRATLTFAIASAVGADVSHSGSGDSPPAVARPVVDDWPMWGGTPCRNMVSEGKNPPTHWSFDKNTNILWKADLGSKTHGSPIVADGVVYVGTNNDLHRDPNQQNDAGVLMAFDARTGRFLWQRLSAKLSTGRVNDWPDVGICSPAFVEGAKLWYCTNRCEVVCLDVSEGRNQKQTPVEIWSVDMRKELGVFPHNMTRTGIAAYRDNIYVITANGVDDTHKFVVAPDAPDIVCFDKNTGRVIWSDNTPGRNILHGQWASVAIAEVNGRALVIAPLGDSWVYAYEAQTGKVVWKFDANLKSAVYPQTRNEILATPVIVNNRMYLATGQDPEHGEGWADFWCVDIAGKGDISGELDADPPSDTPDAAEKIRIRTGPHIGKANPNSAVLWHVNSEKKVPRKQQPIARSISTVAVTNGLVFCPDFSGFLHCYDADTGKVCWSHDLDAATWSSPLACDGKVFLGDEDGDVIVMAASKTEKLLATNDCGEQITTSQVYANGIMYVATRDKLLAIREKK